MPGTKICLTMGWNNNFVMNPTCVVDTDDEEAGTMCVMTTFIVLLSSRCLNFLSWKNIEIAKETGQDEKSLTGKSKSLPAACT